MIFFIEHPLSLIFPERADFFHNCINNDETKGSSELQSDERSNYLKIRVWKLIVKSDSLFQCSMEQKKHIIYNNGKHKIRMNWFFDK